MKVNYIIVGLLVLSQQMLAQQPTLFNYFPTNQSATFYGQAKLMVQLQLLMIGLLL